MTFSLTLKFAFHLLKHALQNIPEKPKSFTTAGLIASHYQVYCGLTSQGQLIAVKQVILDSSDADAANKEYSRLQGEVELLKTLRHINIVGFLGTSLQQHVVSIFMEYIPGGSIASIIHRLV